MPSIKIFKKHQNYKVYKNGKYKYSALFKLCLLSEFLAEVQCLLISQPIPCDPRDCIPVACVSAYCDS